MPCKNDGTCLDERGGFRCLCMPGMNKDELSLKVSYLYATNVCKSVQEESNWSGKQAERLTILAWLSQNESCIVCLWELSHGCYFCYICPSGIHHKVLWLSLYYCYCLNVYFHGDENDYGFMRRSRHFRAIYIPLYSFFLKYYSMHLTKR